MAAPHTLPDVRSPRLDLRQPPANPADARGYVQLVSLLQDLGRRLDQGQIARSELREWERSVAKSLRETELDALMFVPEEDEFDLTRLPHQRWENLRSILLRRKGLDG